MGHKINNVYDELSIQLNSTREDLKKRIDDLSHFVIEQNEIISTTLDNEKTSMKESLENNAKIMNDKLDRGVREMKDYV